MRHDTFSLEVLFQRSNMRLKDSTPVDPTEHGRLLFIAKSMMIGLQGVARGKALSTEQLRNLAASVLNQANTNAKKFNGDFDGVRSGVSDNRNGLGPGESGGPGPRGGHSAGASET